MLRTATAAVAVTLITATASLAGALETEATPVALATAGPEPEVAVPDVVQRRHRLGFALLFDNDLVGDHDDRWRTGSIAASYVRGYDWTGSAPAQLGELLEFRFLAQSLTPADLVVPNPVDRPYAGMLSLGLHSHANHRGTELSLGADLVIIGPQTGIDSLQKSLHELFDSDPPSAAVLANQIADTIRPTVVAEAARSYALGGNAAIRPFVEARAGDETLVRVGADLTFGALGRGELLVRDPVTGQRYRAIARNAPGYSFVLGGDIAYVADSVYLPSARGYALSDHRDRLRAGVHWQGRRTGVFFGVTYLGEEFAAQPEAQMVGSLQLRLTF